MGELAGLASGEPPAWRYRLLHLRQRTVLSSLCRRLHFLEKVPGHYGEVLEFVGQAGARVLLDALSWPTRGEKEVETEVLSAAELAGQYLGD